ncbi:9615_t:CDS:1, partial [Rhizophagus irregularis]
MSPCELIKKGLFAMTEVTERNQQIINNLMIYFKRIHEPKRKCPLTPLREEYALSMSSDDGETLPSLKRINYHSTP